MFGTVNLWRFGQHASRALGRRIRIAECDVMGVDVVTRSDVLRSIADKLCVFANRCACLHRHGCDLVTRGSTPVARIWMPMNGRNPLKMSVRLMWGGATDFR
ncbi:hypothetical protein GQR58_030310 [Nymphon striatum]|nr:hypothetical protein GQR58_030310 [Nymphon striatum]